MRSVALREFDSRYKYLRKTYLPKNFSRIGAYSSEQHTSTAAFRVLFYAELESFLENLAIRTLSSIGARITSGSSCRGSASLLLLYTSTLGGPPAQFSEIDSRAFLLKIQLACSHEVRRRVERNQGAKAHNLLNLFIPLGVDETAIEEQFLNDLNTFGGWRGDVAHKGLTSITILPDPRESKIVAERIVAGLRQFEQLLKDVAK